MNIQIMLACVIIGTITEALSYWQKLWIYHPPWLRLASVPIVFGLVFGWLSTALADSPAIQRFAIGAGVGIVYEALNLSVLRVFTFPNQRLLFLRGSVALAVGAGMPWGLLTLMAPLFRSVA
jgi:hypothetical protein